MPVLEGNYDFFERRVMHLYFRDNTVLSGNREFADFLYLHDMNIEAQLWRHIY